MCVRFEQIIAELIHLFKLKKNHKLPHAITEVDNKAGI
jgi:hypothetical protein